MGIAKMLVMVAQLHGSVGTVAAPERYTLKHSELTIVTEGGQSKIPEVLGHAK
jgi:hypothetical protein